jgi:uncharacterized membrane-anchored protein YjiN (DUF445 family)
MPPAVDLERGLRRMKLAATGLLLLMAAIYVASRLLEGRYPVLAAVSAFSEAGCVGALADWFAVVALFRHPLNLPIPRTAIIPRNRDRIGDALARFVLENFLSRDVLEGRLSSADLAGLAGAWMSDEKNALDMAERVAEYLPLLVNRLNGEGEGAEGAAGSSGAGALKSAAGLARAAVDQITQSPSLRKLAGDLSRLWNNARAWVLGRSIPAGPSAGSAADLTGEPEPHPPLKGGLSFIGRALMSRIMTDAGRLDPDLLSQIAGAITEVGRLLTTDKPLKEKANVWLRASVADAATANRQVLVKLISETVKKWDPRTTSRRIELHVGKDLQWIRINGTIVGGLTGLLIYFLSWMVRSLR